MKFYKCAHCGQIIAKVLDNNVPVVCCGEPMKEIVPNTVDAAMEKHVPVVKEEGNKVLVKVGDVNHPMEDAHYIQWIFIVTDRGRQRKALKPGQPPVAEFALLDNEVLLEVYAYCNLHGLWKADF